MLKWHTLILGNICQTKFVDSTKMGVLQLKGEIWTKVGNLTIEIQQFINQDQIRLTLNPNSIVFVTKINSIDSTFPQTDGQPTWGSQISATSPTRRHYKPFLFCWPLCRFPEQIWSYCNPKKVEKIRTGSFSSLQISRQLLGGLEHGWISFPYLLGMS